MSELWQREAATRAEAEVRDLVNDTAARLGTELAAACQRLAGRKKLRQLDLTAAARASIQPQKKLTADGYLDSVDDALALLGRWRAALVRVKHAPDGDAIPVKRGRRAAA